MPVLSVNRELLAWHVRSRAVSVRTEIQCELADVNSRNVSLQGTHVDEVLWASFPLAFEEIGLESACTVSLLIQNQYIVVKSSPRHQEQAMRSRGLMRYRQSRLC